ncbi:MAG: hypothetical protein KTR31_00170 [Myxococcales bacterium]|nr:hypothetical protein [Myxococcales bacterium]
MARAGPAGQRLIRGVSRLFKRAIEPGRYTIVMPHSTNYTDTFITLAPDSVVQEGRQPPPRKRPTAAAQILAWVQAEPYAHTSDDLLFRVYADKHGIPESDRAAAREAFFAKPQACLRANALPKSYGWGVHHDGRGRIALIGVDSPEYDRLAAGNGPDGPVKVVAAMRSRRQAT